MSVHRSYEGEWRTCAAPEICSKPHHIPDITPEQAAALPFRILLQLMEATDPPDVVTDTYKAWYIQFEGRTREHRDYDLPAVIWSDGKLEWFQYGVHWRDSDHTPTIIHGDGRMEYWQGGPQTPEMARRQAARIARRK